MKKFTLLFGAFLFAFEMIGQKHSQSTRVGEIAFESYFSFEEFTPVPWIFLGFNNSDKKIRPIFKLGFNTAEKKNSMDFMVGQKFGTTHSFLAPMIGVNLSEKSQVQLGFIIYNEKKRHEFLSVNHFWGGTFFSLNEYFFTLKEKEGSKLRAGAQFEYLHPSDEEVELVPDQINPKRNADITIGPLMKFSFGKVFLKTGVLFGVSGHQNKGIVALGINFH